MASDRRGLKNWLSRAAIGDDARAQGFEMPAIAGVHRQGGHWIAFDLASSMDSVRTRPRDGIPQLPQRCLPYTARTRLSQMVLDRYGHPVIPVIAFSSNMVRVISIRQAVGMLATDVGW